jgi:hypothetical protein
LFPFLPLLVECVAPLFLQQHDVQIPFHLALTDVWCLQCEVFYYCIVIRNRRRQNLCTRFVGDQGCG